MIRMEAFKGPLSDRFMAQFMQFSEDVFEVRNASATPTLPLKPFQRVWRFQNAPRPLILQIFGRQAEDTPP